MFLCYLSTLTNSGPYLYCDVIFLVVQPEVAKERVDVRTEQDKDRDSERDGVDIHYLRELDCVMLFVALYARARGVLRVNFLNWDKFGPARRVADRILRTKAQAPQPDKQLLERVLAANYQQLTEIASDLCVNISSDE